MSNLTMVNDASKLPKPKYYDETNSTSQYV